jgi:hypothetical protein
MNVRPVSGLRTKWTQSHPTPRKEIKKKIRTFGLVLDITPGSPVSSGKMLHTITAQVWVRLNFDGSE